MNRTTLVEKLRKRGMIVPLAKNRVGEIDPSSAVFTDVVGV
jgi:hypothetical protein